MADFEAASEHLIAYLAPREGSWWVKSLRSLATIAAGLMTHDLESGPSVTDLVVMRKDTGRPVIRMSAGTLAEASDLLRRVRDDLDTMRVEEFVLKWRRE
ncbi:hypothetical protein ABZ477_11490 [Microbacterium sp. NPDC019599]|uniref:hypothetical protein n=1 Tax=Microbacterium sp. NPDC019599 TaxID=3154690 RepID=UPI0033C19640